MLARQRLGAQPSKQLIERPALPCVCMRHALAPALWRERRMPFPVAATVAASNSSVACRCRCLCRCRAHAASSARLRSSAAASRAPPSTQRPLFPVCASSSCACAAPQKNRLKKSVRLIAAVRTTAACRAAAAAWRCVPTSASMSPAVVCLYHGFSVAHASDVLFERCLRAAAAAAAGGVLPVCQAPESAERLQQLLLRDGPLLHYRRCCCIGALHPASAHLLQCARGVCASVLISRVHEWPAQEISV